MAKQPQRPAPQPQRKAAPAPARRSSESRESIFTAADRTLIFGRQNFMLMGIGLALVLVGLALMTGGAMPDPAKWEPERIYSPMRITVAPILMVAGFVVVVMGIFKKSASETPNDQSATEA
ncbi:MAG: DUF3098 domain-containing protein [Saprospiraceae bacterium]|nr:DUF3098 domain-containing protein [Saprospiraceae bacterium]